MLSISLYGCETWSLTEELYGRLSGMHAQHLRAMCRVTRTHVWKYHISTQGQRLGLNFIDFYVFWRQLRWAGHVSRIPWITTSGCRGACYHRGCRSADRWARQR